MFIKCRNMRSRNKFGMTTNAQDDEVRGMTNQICCSILAPNLLSYEKYRPYRHARQWQIHARESVGEGAWSALLRYRSGDRAHGGEAGCGDRRRGRLGKFSRTGSRGVCRARGANWWDDRNGWGSGAR